MKQLTIEEKAKAYDEAIKRAKEINNEKKAQPFDVMLKIFPELKESEDEKSKKWILEYLYDGLRKSDEQFKEQFKCAIAWLEKQGKKDSQVTPPTFTFDDVLALQCCMETVKKVQEDKELYEQLQSLHNRIHDVYWLEKQSEKKPTDKIEPKFKVGDWITNGAINPAQISSIKDGMYFIYNDTISEDVEYIDKEYHLWSIQDAKDGDVLIYNHQPFKWIFIFKRLYSPIIVSYYVMFTEKNKIYIDDSISTNFLSKITPATKEQRDLFFAKMKENGYEFDFEKKELKKIEQNNTEEYIETKGLSELEAEAEELTKEISDEIEADKVVIKQGEHNSAWSEEDTETLNGIVNYLFTSTDVSSIEGSDKWYDWLKSLKNRVIPKQEWSEEDDNCLSTIIAEFSKCAGKSVSKDEWMRCNDFLNSIRDRVQSPQKQKWSEEDENMLRRIFDSLNTYAKNAYPILKSIVEEEIDWLKSLKYRKLCVYNPYKAVVESIAKMCNKYKNRMSDEEEAKDFLANAAVKCREAAEYNKKYMEE